MKSSNANKIQKMRKSHSNEYAQEGKGKQNKTKRGRDQREDIPSYSC